MSLHLLRSDSLLRSTPTAHVVVQNRVYTLHGSLFIPCMLKLRLFSPSASRTWQGACGWTAGPEPSREVRTTWLVNGDASEGVDYERDAVTAV